MKLISFILLLTFTSKVYSQDNGLQLVRKTNLVEKNSLRSDTSLIVVDNSAKNEIRPAFFINGKLYDILVMKSIGPQGIDSVNIVKDSLIIGKQKYSGQILVKIRKDYVKNLMTLNQLKLKYLQLDSKPVIFLIDGEAINVNPDDYIVDENYILKIIADKINVANEQLQLNVVRLLTKSEENLRKSKEILIR